ncbi:MAG: histidinol-phosphate transaminase, partial [Vicinamibacteria bacterium]
YSVAAPSATLALEALSDKAQAESQERIALTVRERDALFKKLRGARGVTRVYASEGNYLLVRFHDADAALARLLSAGVVVRDMRAMPQLGDALRISVGTPEENQSMIHALLEVAGK